MCFLGGKISKVPILILFVILSETALNDQLVSKLFLLFLAAVIVTHVTIVHLQIALEILSRSSLTLQCQPWCKLLRLAQTHLRGDRHDQ